MLELMHDALSGRIGESDGDAGGSEKGQWQATSENAGRWRGFTAQDVLFLAGNPW